MGENKPIKKRVRSVEQVVDMNTGEVLTTRKEFTIETSPDEFMLVFITQMAPLYRIKSGTAIQLLAYLCSIAQFNSCEVSFTTAKRQQFIEMTKVSSQTISNSLKELKDLGLIQGDRGDYTINPEVMWKGSTKEREAWMTGKGLQVMMEFRRATTTNIPVASTATPAKNQPDGTLMATGA
jgi:hypothetical protein